MKAARFPLYAKILLWFFLNLLVLAFVAAVTLRVQFGSAPEMLVSGAAGDRLEAMARVIREELLHQPQAQWNGILERFSKAYGVQLYLFRNDGGQVAGKRVEPPPPVVEQFMRGRRGGRGQFFEGGPPARSRERMEPDGPFGGFDLPGRPAPEEGRRRRGPPPFEDGPERRRFGMGTGQRVRFAIRTEEPRQYWIGMPAPVPEEGREPAPGTLILATQSISAGGLLLDMSGWVWIAAGALLFSVLFWLPLVRSLTRSISQMHGATAQIAEGKFEVRVDEKRRDELGLLGAGINRMTSRLDGFVTGQKRFLGDIAHELCSPLARMQMALGILEERADEKQSGYVRDVKEEAQHMAALVNELLSFSKASLGSSTIRLESVELRPLIERAIKREEQDTQILNEAPAGLSAIADRELMVRALSNLLRNAIQYAGPKGRITVSARSENAFVEISVADEGPGVPETELPKLFEPFYRVDQSRARETGGVGLGLAIVKTCVESCHGTVSCRNRKPAGFEVLIRLAAGE